MAGKAAAQSPSTTAAAGALTQNPPPGGGTPNVPSRAFLGPSSRVQPGRHTLHIEYAVWSSSWRLIHTRPDGTRAVHRRGIPSLRTAKLRAQVAADMTGWEYTDG